MKKKPIGLNIDTYPQIIKAWEGGEKTSEELQNRLDEILYKVDKYLPVDEQEIVGEMLEIVRELTLREE